MLLRRLLRIGALVAALGLATTATGALAAPVFSLTPPVYPEAAVNQVYRYNVEGRVHASGTGAVLYSLLEGPVGARVDPLSGTLRWTPTNVGTYSFIVEAKDGLGATNLTWSVTAKDIATTVSASMTASVSSGTVPLTVTFGVSATSNVLDALNVVWEAGDGTPAAYEQGAAWTHTYKLPGTYVARATVYDQHGGSAVVEKLIQVKNVEGLLPPTARIVSTGGTSGADPLSTTLSCDCTAGSAVIEKYLWSVDGNPLTTQASFDWSFVFGSYELQLVVVDANGLMSRAVTRLDVSKDGNLPPSCSARVTPSSGVAPIQVEYSVSADPGTAPLKRVEWTLDDWSIVRDFSAPRSYDAPGWYVSRVEVEDTLGFKCHSSAAFAATDSTGAMPPAMLTVAPSAAVCGEPYVYEPSTLGDGTFTWSLHDAPEGMSVDASTGKVSWVPRPDQRGETSFVLIASGSSGQTSENIWIGVSCPDKVALGTPFGCAAGGPSLIAGAAWLVIQALRSRRAKR